MSSRTSSSSLLILSNQVYAKQEDGSYYPGLIRSKQDDSYIVQFAKDGITQVMEDDLVWLGFWGLPTWCWPEHPVIHTTVASHDSFDGKIMFLGNNTTEERTGPVSFTIRENGGAEKCPPEGSYSSKWSLVEGQRHRPEKSTRTLARSLVEQGEKQPRSTVLRLNKDLLHKENSSDFLSSSVTSKPKETNAKYSSSGPVQSIPELLKKDPKIDKFSIERIGRTYCETNEPEEVRWSLSGGGTTDQRRADQIRLLPNSRWYTRDWTETFSLNQSNLTPPITPFGSSGCISPEPAVFGETYQAPASKGFLIESMELFHAGQARKKRGRNDAKKCRKVYGVENRHSWCTQCRWKKACTRFKQ